jgi:DNA-binding CsgD family transcriptional regulator
MMLTIKTIRTETGYQLDNMHVNAKPFSCLPTQQARTLLFIAQGLPQKFIAQAMGVKVSTVKKACNDLSFKLHTQSMRETVHQAIKQGVLRYSLCMFLCLLSALGGDLDRSFRTVRSTRTTRASRNNKTRRLKALQADFLSC